MEIDGICKGSSDCTAFSIFIAIVLIAIFLNYLQRCLQSSRTSSSSSNNNILPLYDNTNPTNTPPPNTPLSVHSPLYRHALNSLPSSPYDPNTHSRNYKNNPTFDKSSDDNNNNNNNNIESCAICLGEFEKGESVRVLPKCKHVYHVECIDQWLLRALHCPVCRMRVVDLQQHRAKILNPISSVQVRFTNHFPAASVILL